MLGQPRKPLQKGLFYSSLAAIAVAPSSVCLYERQLQVALTQVGCWNKFVRAYREQIEIQFRRHD